MAPNALQIAKSFAVFICLINYILIPFDTQVMRSIVDLNWLNLVAYVLIEQLFLASFRRLDYRIVGYIPMVVALTQLGLRRDPFSFLQAQEMGLLLPVVIDAASNVAALVLAINLSNPARPNVPMFEFASLLVVFGSYVLPTQPAEYPFKAVVSSGTWEQVRLLTSFLSLRITAGGLLQAIVLNVSQQWDLRIGILRSRCNLDLDEPSSEDVKGNAKPKPKFELNVSVALILAAAVAAMLSACIAVTNQVVVLVLKVRALRTADFPWI